MRLPVLFERLNQIEKKLESVLRFANQPGRHDPRTETDLGVTTPIATIATPAQTERSDSVVQLPATHAGFTPLSEEFIRSVPLSTPEEHSLKARYLGKQPFACEEYRLPLPDFLTQTAPTRADDIMPFIEHFLDGPGSVYPIMCPTMPYRMLESIRNQGFGANIPSCFLLLLIALSKAFRLPENIESGVADFQRAMRHFICLNVQFSLEYVQTQVLLALFFFKKARLLSFRSLLHAGCVGVYTLIKRYGHVKLSEL